MEEKRPRGRPRKTDAMRQAEQKAERQKFLSSNPDIKLVDVKEAAWLLRWDKTTVRRYILEGQIPATMNPRNPLDLAEANGLKNNHRSSKVRYRIQKSFLAHMIYGKYINQELQPMSEQELAEAINKLNASLREYEAELEQQEA